MGTGYLSSPLKYKDPEQLQHSTRIEFNDPNEFGSADVTGRNLSLSGYMYSRL